MNTTFLKKFASAAPLVLILGALSAVALSPTQDAKIVASDADGGDEFSQSVSIDGETVLVGAFHDEAAGLFAGSAYVFTRSGSTWTQQAKILADDPARFDQFGASVALDGNTAVIAAIGRCALPLPFDCDNPSASVFVFTRSGSTWTQQAELEEMGAGPRDSFGRMVAIDADTAVVGASRDDDAAENAGAAYIFVRSGSTWTKQAKLVATDAAANDNFGDAVAVDGNTVVIGALNDDDGGSSTGSAYVFTRSGSTWTQQAKLVASDRAAFDHFSAQSVAVDGNTVIIGTAGDDDAGNQSGSAYVFIRSGTTWTQQAKLVSTDLAAGDNFGAGVAVEGNIAVVGAFGDDDDGSLSGSAYVFTRSGSTWTQQAKLVATDAAAGDQFARFMSMNGNWVVLSAHRDDDAGSVSGSAYVFGLNAAPVADAGPDQTKDEALSVTLDGSASTNATNYAWSQVAGPSVTLSSTTVVNPDFTAPYVNFNTTLTFQLIVEDTAGNFSEPDTVDITVVSVNNPPVADAGDDGTIKEGAVATLDGSNSFDPEGDSPLGYTWTQTAGISVTLQPSNSIVSPTFTAPLGVGNQFTFDLVVDDTKEFSAADSVTITVVENSPPVADAGPDDTVDEGALVNLDGTASSDPDGGDTLSFDWTEPVGLDDDTSPTPSFTAPAVNPGGQDITFDLVVTDDDPVNAKSSDPDSVTISVRNANDPPSCDLARASCPASKIKNNAGCTLWPPNHKLTAVSIEGVMDADSVYNDVTLQITGVTQDEPVNGGGDGDSSPDAVIQNSEPADSVLVRAERSGQENGRVYVVTFTADDGFESCTGSVSIGVPHDRKDTPVDDGQAFDSTQP